MASDPRQSAPAARDGTSQAGRIARELDPAHAPVEERTTRDLLAFASAYARELRYFDPAAPDSPRGDWAGFFAPVDLDEAAAYASQPEQSSAEKAGPYARPHFALLLAVLELFGHARTQLNGLTRRHLEFFYRDVLRMTRKAAVPDHVHVVVGLEAGTDNVEIAAGTALRAGQDALGQDLVYVTDQDSVASQVEVAEIRALRAGVRVTGVREASRQHLISGTQHDAVVAMMRIALGHPDPGDPLPVPIYPGVPPPAQGPGVPAPDVTFDVLMQVYGVVDVARTGLWMPVFDELRTLMRLKRRRQAEEGPDWAAINALLEKAGRKRDAAFRYRPTDPTAFAANLRTVLNKTAEEFAHLYDGLPEVKSIEEAYATYATRADVATFIQTQLFLSLDDFESMMQTKLRMDGHWNEINRLLEEAGRRKRGDTVFELPAAVRAGHDFDAKLAAAVGTPNYKVPGGLEDYYRTFVAIERYFFMPAEHLHYIMSVAAGAGTVGDEEWDWGNVYDIVTAAHREKIYGRRREALLALAQPGIAAGNPARALAAMLAKVLGAPAPDDSGLQRFVEESWPRLGAGVSAGELAYLRSVADRSEPAPDWARVANALEIAQRNREHFTEPVPQKVEWRNLYAAGDARTGTVSSATPESQAPRPWKTFGPGERLRSPLPLPQPTFGWAIGSALLALSEGARAIELVLGFSSDAASFSAPQLRTLLAPPDGNGLVATFNPFVVELSTEKGWVQPAAVGISWSSPQMLGYPRVPGIDTSKLAALTISVTLSEGQPALAAPVREVHGIVAQGPVLRLMLRPIWSEPDDVYRVAGYDVLRRLSLLRARLSVSVAGLKGVTIRNDHTTLDAKKPFEPFGTSPAAGSRFYLGHPELVAKRLDSVSMRLTWMGLPPVLADYYANYPSQPANAAYTATVALMERGVAKAFGNTLGLFDAGSTATPVDRTLTPPTDQGNPEQATTASADVAEWSRHFVLELASPDFQHAVYSRVALQKSMELAAAISNGTPRPLVPATYQVNPPVTPKLKSLSLGYVASTEVAFDVVAVGAPATCIFHVEPFGYAALRPEAGQTGSPLLPQFDFEGELLVGLRRVAAPQNVALLFQVSEGSANPDLTPEPIQWSYLSGNRWRSFHDGSLLSDGTRGLINSGIVELALGPAEPNTRLPEDLYWIRAAIAGSADSVCDMVNVHANAVRATFDDRGNTLEHLSQALPAGRISEPEVTIAGVDAISQPYPSFGGKLAEQDIRFYTRVSERLRHKQRALTPWDYERLVLEKFPQLYKVKCLRADPVAHPRTPGRIVLIVIPDIRSRLPLDPFEPKAPADLIRDIEMFLVDKTPPFARVTVRNAHYVPVKVRCGVRFVPGSDESFTRKRLTDELNRFLSPWAYQDGADLVIGGNVYANSIIDFIEQREYVDYIAEFKLFTSEDGGATFSFIPETDDYHAGTRSDDGVLVAARTHQFDVISHADYRVEVFSGINYMQIGLDFIVA